MPKRYKNMTDIARGMGFDGIAELPQSKLSEFCERINGVYGNRKARMMVLRQLMYRKGIGNYRSKFRDIWDILKDYNNKGRISWRTK